MSASTPRVAIVPDEGDFAELLRRAAERSFTHIEIAGCEDRPEVQREALAESGLFVRAVRLGRGMGAEDATTRRAMLEQQKRRVIDAAQLGATIAILTSPDITSEVARSCFAEGRDLLAAFASGRGVQVVIEGENLPYERVTLPPTDAI